ncbi:nucleotidyltransferase [Chryseobacterium salviniae]|uniref:Nucleotidyltransferase n=1 Tax=Chryseobacterium salviniae TaxID=3101750 RepID=A0ABU6HSB0_9FLAO|nr:nucleotidyltransferase [Chryseobacterium sp. T9W2-O]MEC3875927.1 nucleotidyltransferase [Chryseobacterium sp. T9W2-O]
MNKTFEEIFAEMLAEKASKAELSELNSTSKVSIWRLLLQVVSFVIYNFQLAANLHLQEIRDLIASQKVFNLRRYRNEALRFQYGFDLQPETDKFKSTYEDNGVDVIATDEQIEASKIVKYAACNRVIENSRSKIVMKIAPADLDGVFTTDQMEAFSKYIEEIAPAGDHVTIINYLPDILNFSFKIKYDPMVLKADGMNILTAKYPVQQAIENFLKNLPFNGELSVQKLETAILDVDGVIDLQTLQIQSKWIDPAQNGYGIYQPINMAVIPVSGRFKIEDFTGLQYIV